jgi:hypothetical protein
VPLALRVYIDLIPEMIIDGHVPKTTVSVKIDVLFAKCKDSIETLFAQVVTVLRTRPGPIKNCPSMLAPPYLEA